MMSERVWKTHRDNPLMKKHLDNYRSYWEHGDDGDDGDELAYLFGTVASLERTILELNTEMLGREAYTTSLESKLAGSTTTRDIT